MSAPTWQCRKKEGLKSAPASSMARPRTSRWSSRRMAASDPGGHSQRPPRPVSIWISGTTVQAAAKVHRRQAGPQLLLLHRRFGVYALQGGAKRGGQRRSLPECAGYRPPERRAERSGYQQHQFVRHDVFKSCVNIARSGREVRCHRAGPSLPRNRPAAGACRGYKDINMLAFQLLAPGGVLLTLLLLRPDGQACSRRSWPMRPSMPGRDAQILELLSQASDHPIGTAYPEGFYLRDWWYAPAIRPVKPLVPRFRQAGHQKPAIWWLRRQRDNLPRLCHQQRLLPHPFLRRRLPSSIRLPHR